MKTDNSTQNGHSDHLQPQIDHDLWLSSLQRMMDYLAIELDRENVGMRIFMDCNRTNYNSPERPDYVYCNLTIRVGDQPPEDFYLSDMDEVFRHFVENNASLYMPRLIDACCHMVIRAYEILGGRIIISYQWEGINLDSQITFKVSKPE